MKSIRLRLSHKIGLLAPIAVLGIAAVVTINSVEKGIEEEARRTAQAIQTADSTLKNLEIRFLQNRRAEKDFLIARDAKYVQTHAEIGAEARALLSDLKGMLTNPVALENLAKIELRYEKYLSEFAALGESNVILGLDANEGEVGEIRTAIRSMEKKLATITDKDLLISLLTMRRHEKDYLARRDARYVARFEAEADKFASFGASLFGETDTHAEIMLLLNAYRTAFTTYASTAEQEAMLRAQVTETFATIDPIFTELDALLAEDLATSQAESAEMISFARNSGIAAILAAVLLLGATVFAVGRTISRPVVATTRAMTRLAGGDTNIDIAYADRTDEIGEMAAAVEIFRQSAIANRRLEEEAEANRVRAEQDRIRLQQEAEAAAQMRLKQATSGLAAGLHRLAEGDLSFQLTEAFAPDFEQLRHDLNAAINQLGGTLSEVAQSCSSIDGGSREISESADDLSKRTEQQAASLEETAAALDQITANVTSSTKRAEEARAVAGQANASASHSEIVVGNAVAAMHRIEESSRQISNIIGVIDEIAFQTNLLALNAGVEAARAGEAGKGFAVVAQEVRELAQRSAKAAREIKDLIRNSTGEVESGVRLVSDTGEALKTIGKHVATINQHMDAIATSAREQSVGLGEVNTAVNQMDQVTQKNAAMVEEANAASATLAHEATRLRELIARFSLPAPDHSYASGAATLRATAHAMAAPVAAARPAARRSQPAFYGNAAISHDQWEEF